MLTPSLIRKVRSGRWWRYYRFSLLCLPLGPLKGRCLPPPDDGGWHLPFRGPRGRAAKIQKNSPQIMSNQKSPQDNFYIGWQEKAPLPYAQNTRRFIGMVAAVLLITAVALVATQKGFENSTFELGKISAHEGVLVKKPVPMLKVFSENRTTASSILLLGFGKAGAEATLAAIEAQEGQPLDQKSVRLEGTLIYHNGKTALELTKGPAAFAGFLQQPRAYSPRSVNHGDVSLRGEILDPKCALGVMKPGYGKPHRSCAVRCIAGGIPPIMRVSTKEGEVNYCLVVGEDGSPVNQQLLDYVADQVQLCGRLEQQDDWLVLYTDPASQLYRLKPHWMEGDLPVCHVD